MGKKVRTANIISKLAMRRVMKSILNHIAVASVCLAATCLFSSHLYADDYAPPTYRGKVILVVDKTVAADPQVSSKIERLTQDLAGDGWRVLRHDVERGPVLPINGSSTDYTLWAQQNAPRVREVRALIKADYDAAPAEVKNVFLIGHVPVPYSGTTGNLSGGHYYGATPADLFYGEMSALYGPGGWSDLDTASSVRLGCDNLPGDGKFDQNLLPSPMELGVGRVDLSLPILTAFFGVNEATLLSRYLDKDHDFRCCVFAIHRRAIGFKSLMKPVFGEDNVLEIGDNQWFLNVSGSGQDYLLGGVDGTGNGNVLYQLGTTADFVVNDSRVVFCNFHGSYFGNWGDSTFLNAPLANPYDPANGRYGYGLGVVWGFLGLDEITLTKRALGATLGEALFSGYTDVPNFGLMGDPTLRMHSVLPVSSLSVTKTDTTVTLSWMNSPDATEGYNIYRAPTRNGPFVLVNADGPVTGITYNAARPSTGDPDNFYMVRAVKTELPPTGTTLPSYVNMSEGVLASLPGYLTNYLNIVSSPANQLVGFNAGDGVANSAAFNVDAGGVDAAGNGQISYQWFKDGVPLSSEDCHFSGVNSPGLLIKGVQSADVGNYYVVVGNSSGSLTSAPASLSILTAADDSYTIVRNTPTDLDVLSNDSANRTGGVPPSNTGLTIKSVSALSHSEAGTITINSDNRTIHFAPNHKWLGPVTFFYIMTDGTGTASATVTMNVITTPINTPPTVSTIADQQMTQDTTIDVSFTASDDFTTPDDLIYVATCSNPTLIPNGNFSVTGNGTARVLHIKAGTHQYGSGVVTLSVTDDDRATTTIPSFQVTINQANTPTLLQPGFSNPNTFNFTIVSGLANSVVEVKESDDLVTWKSLGTVTLSGNFYNFVDNSAGSSTHRFYNASSASGCSVNTIGFIQVTVPANGTAMVANQLNNPAGNTVPVLFAGAPVGTVVQKWNSTTQSYTASQYVYAHGSVHWNNPTATLNPGEGAFIGIPTATPWTVTFVGDVPQGQQVNNDLPTTAGNYSFISSIIPRAGYLSTLGFPPVEGDQIVKWIGGQLVTTATYTSGNWSSPTPTVAIGESFLVQSGSSVSSRQPWTENFSGCLPEVSLTSPADGSVLIGPAVIALSANATADAGITRVEFFQGNTSLEVATPNGNSYSLNWNSPAAGVYSLTAHATDNNGVTMISAPANITVYAQPSLSSEVYSGGSFQFTINGNPGASVEVKASDDLVTWTSLGTVTLTGGSYNYVDTAAGHRFYRVQENGACSVNTIGFIQVTVPANGTAMVANQLNNPAGNTVPVLFAGAQVGTVVQKWNSTTQGYTASQYVYAHGSVHWNNPTATLNPGEGAFIGNPTATPWTVTFVGDVPQGQQVNNDLPTTAGNYSFISSIIPRAGYLSTLGFPPVEGDQIVKWIGGQLVTTATYTSGNWSSPTPTVAIGESFLVQSGSSVSSRQPWTENFSGCLPEVSLTSPADGSVLIGPAVIALSANATADAGITRVEFFQGNTSLEVATPNGNSYSLNWNSPAAGVYSLTAHATDNNGVTMISAPANITVYAQPSLSSEVYSGGSFQFTINGNPGASVEVKASDDLVTWTSLGTVTLTGGSYNYVDTAAGHRFYRVQENGACSVNTIGFIQVTVPANGTAMVANQLNNPAGNTVPVLFAGAQVGTVVQKWNSTTQGYTASQYVYAHGSVHWNNPTATLNPGEGAFIGNPTATPWTVTFVGDVPQGQQVNNDLPTTAGNYSFISSIIPRAGYLSTLGFPPVEGDQILQWVGGQLVTTATYTSGNWSSPTPTVAIGGGFFVQCGNTVSSRLPWTENYFGCP